MQNATTTPEKLEKLWRIVIDPRSGEVFDFPISLTQISTIGETHSHSPYCYVKYQPGFFGVNEKRYDILRIYLDGAIFHVHWSKDNLEPLNGHSLFLGYSEKLHILGVSYEASFQYENLLTTTFESVFGQSSFSDSDS